MRDDASPMTNVSGMAETPDTAGKALEPRADSSHLASAVWSSNIDGMLILNSHGISPVETSRVITLKQMIF